MKIFFDSTIVEVLSKIRVWQGIDIFVLNLEFQLFKCSLYLIFLWVHNLKG